jgi:PAS domain S-box-containing protein
VIAAKKAASASRGTRILLVDDNPDNLVSLEATLEGIGDEIVSVQSGEEALRQLLQSDFAAILLDVKMPEMDGFEAAELIRARRRSRHTPILFLTAYRNDAQLFRGYDLGAVDFLFKPIVPEILRSKVAVFTEMARNTELLREQASVLAKAEQKFRSLLEATPDAMLITREEGTIELVNSHAQQLFGYNRQALLGRNLRSLVPRWDHAGQAGRVAAPRLNGQTMPETDPQGIRRDGTRFPVEISLSPLLTEEGLLITSVIRDVTERKRSEESIHRLNAELERRVAERTAELMRSNEALRQFAWAASHDLQEPLRMVITYSQWLERHYKHQLQDAEQFLGYVTEGATRMSNLLDALRKYIQTSEAGEEEAVATEAASVLDQAIKNLRSAIEESGAIITRDPLPTVVAVPVLLLGLFQNLIGNAIKYKGELPPEVHVSAELEAGEWLFRVRDNGMGIEPQYHQRIFGVFKRLHRDAYPGTGIGLAICKTAAEQMGGRIWVESELGRGATFCFTIPTARGAEQQ